MQFQNVRGHKTLEVKNPPYINLRAYQYAPKTMVRQVTHSFCCYPPCQPPNCRIECHTQQKPYLLRNHSYTGREGNAFKHKGATYGERQKECAHRRQRFGLRMSSRKISGSGSEMKKERSSKMCGATTPTHIALAFALALALALALAFASATALATGHPFVLRAESRQ